MALETRAEYYFQKNWGEMFTFVNWFFEIRFYIEICFLKEKQQRRWDEQRAAKRSDGAQ